MNNIFIDVDYAQIFKHGQKIGGDVFLLSRNPENNQIVCTLSDGLGSGVKANVLASLTAHMAHKLSFSPINLKDSARIIMDTLPVCKERKISYATFTIADIHYKAQMESIKVNLVEYDNPEALRFSNSESRDWQRIQTKLSRKGAFKEESVKQSEFNLEVGDRLIMFSDGVTQSGLGKSLPLGWRLDGVRKFITQQLEKDPDISSRALSAAIVQHGCLLDGMCSKDDITAVVVYIRKPRRTLIVTGPPFSKESDKIMADKIRNFDGVKIVSGGTTALIVSRELKAKVKVDLSCWSKDIPPSSIMEGIDLVTEGMLTLSKVADVLERKQSVDTLDHDAVRRYVDLLLNSDQVHFIVGTKINEAHQDPNIPLEIGIRRTIIRRLCYALENGYLKETSVEYI